MQEIAILISTVAGTCTAAAIRKYRINKIKTPTIIGANTHIKNQMDTLQVEKQVLTKSISRLYQDDVGLTPIQRDRVLLKYQHRLAIILSRIEKLEQVSKHPDLGPLGDGLVTLMDQKLSQLDQRLYELTSRIKISDNTNPKFKSQLDTIIGKPSNFGQDNQQDMKQKIEISTLTTVPKMHPGEQKSTKIDAMLEELKKDVITPPKHVITPPKHEDVQKPIVKETKQEIIQTPEIIISNTPTVSKPEIITRNEEIKPQPIQLPKDIEIDEKDDNDDDDLTKIKEKIMKTLESLDQTEVD